MRATPAPLLCGVVVQSMATLPARGEGDPPTSDTILDAWRKREAACETLAFEWQGQRYQDLVVYPPSLGIYGPVKDLPKPI